MSSGQGVLLNLQPKYLPFTVISAHAVGIHKDKYQPASVYTYNVQATWSKDFKAGHLKIEFLDNQILHTKNYLTQNG